MSVERRPLIHPRVRNAFRAACSDYSVVRPIELAFAKLKKLLRDGAARTVDKLWELCGKILEQFTESECRNYFQHCGYRQT